MGGQCFSRFGGYSITRYAEDVPNAPGWKWLKWLGHFNDENFRGYITVVWAGFMCMVYRMIRLGFIPHPLVGLVQQRRFGSQ